MKGAFRIIKIKGISLYIHWTFLLLFGWIALVNARTGNNVEQLSWSLFFICAVFACVALHEFGHAFVASLFGIKAKNIVLLPIGGVASIEKFPDNPAQELAISIAGPLVNILIAAVLIIFIQPYKPFWEGQPNASITHGHDLMYNLHLVNIGLAAFNLIPAFPMDGGRILRALLGFRMNYVRATSIAATVGKIIAGFFIAFGILFYNIILPVIGIFIIISASTEEYYLRLKSLVKGVKLKDILMYDYDSLQSDLTVGQAMEFMTTNHSKYFILMNGAVPLGSINRIEIIKAIADKNYEQRIGNLVRENLQYLNGDDEVELVLEKLASHPDVIYPVMVNSKFAGVVNFNHVVEYLLLHGTYTADYGRIKSLAGLLR